MNKILACLVLTSCILSTTILLACPSDNYGIYFVNDKIEQMAVEVDDAWGNSLTGLPYRVDSRASFELCVPQNQVKYQIKYNPVLAINSKFIYWISADILRQNGGFLYIRATDSSFRSEFNAPGPGTVSFSTTR